MAGTRDRSPEAKALHGESPGGRLPASQRVRKRREFKLVQDQGNRFTAGALVVMLRSNDLGYRRLGLTVSRKVGNAVVRTKVKRWLREVFRKERGRLPDSVDAVIIARSSAASAGQAKLSRDFRAVAGAAKSGFSRRSGP